MQNQVRYRRQRKCTLCMVCVVICLYIIIRQKSKEYMQDEVTSNVGEQRIGQNLDNKDDEQESSDLKHQFLEQDLSKDKINFKHENFRQNQNKDTSNLQQDSMDSDKHPQTSSSVPYSADTVRAKRLNTKSVSLAGRLCGEDKCSYEYNSILSYLLPTQDRRLLVLACETKILHVHSASGVDQIIFEHHPFSLTQLYNGLLAITFPEASLILLVDIDAEEHIVKEIKTKRQCCSIVEGFEHNTFIVTSVTHKDRRGAVDVISLQGDVVKTLVPGSGIDSIKVPLSLTKFGQNLLVCAAANPRVKAETTVIQIGQSKSADESHVQFYSDPLLLTPAATSVDEAGNIFIAQLNGSVILRSRDGKFRHLLDYPDEKFPHCVSLVVQGNRLVVAWAAHTDSSSLVAEYSLSDARDYES